MVLIFNEEKECLEGSSTHTNLLCEEVGDKDRACRAYRREEHAHVTDVHIHKEEMKHVKQRRGGHHQS